MAAALLKYRGEDPWQYFREPEAQEWGAGAIPFCPHVPHPGPQATFLALDDLEVLFGGAAGGGKSDALLMAALQYVEVPGYAALLLRRTYADLAKPGALMERAANWFRFTAARWNEQKKTWTFPSGATISFGYLEHEQDKFNYQSAEFQMIAFDELSQFSETQYRYLFSRLRRLEGMPVPLRMRGATNPGAEWVKDRFGIDSKSVEVQRHPEGRIFVPSRLSDNPSVDQEEYLRAMDQLDFVTRQQLVMGDWDIQAEGNMFRRAWFPLKDAVPAIGQAVRYWDLAATEAKAGKDPDWTVGLKLLALPDRTFFVADVLRTRSTPGDVKKLIAQTAALDGKACAVWMEQEPGSSGKTVVADYVKELPGFSVYGLRSTGSKITRARPVSAQAEAGNIAVLNAGWTDSFLQELTLFPQEGVHDDQVDALSGAFEALQQPVMDPLLGMNVVDSVSTGWFGGAV